MKIALVDDELEQRTILLEYLSRFAKENGIAWVVDTYTNPVDFLSSFEDQYSLLLLDIEMPDMTGLELARKIRNRGSEVGIIFCTVMAQYAINGYEVNALDFMVKPVNYFPFSMKMLKAYKNLPKDKKLVVKSEGETVILQERDILYIEGSNQYIVFHLKTNDNVKVKNSLKDIETKLDKAQFARCSNSFIVNLDYATKISGNDLYVGKEILPISRSKKKEFTERMNRHFGGI